MTTPRLLRLLAVVDVSTAVGAFLASSWLAVQVDVPVMPLRIAAALLLVLGVETYLMADRPALAKVRIATEAVCAVAAADLVFLRNPTGIGTALLIGTAIWCAAIAVELVLLQRTRQLSPA
jgi:hypothetical protein